MKNIANKLQSIMNPNYTWTYDEVENTLTVNYLDGVTFRFIEYVDEAILVEDEDGVICITVTYGNAIWEDCDSKEKAYEIATGKVVSRFNYLF